MTLMASGAVKQSKATPLAGDRTANAIPGGAGACVRWSVRSRFEVYGVADVPSSRLVATGSRNGPKVSR